MRSVRVGRVLAGILAFVMVAGLLAFAFRDAIATALVEAALTERGVGCTRVSLGVSADLRVLRVAPTECRIREGRIAEVALPYGMELGIDAAARKVRRVELARASIVTRDVGSADGAAVAMVAEEVPDPMTRSLVGLADALARDALPVVRVGELRASIDGGTVLLRGLQLVPTNHAATLVVDSVVAPARSRGPVELGGRLLRIEGTATAAEARVRGVLVVDVALGPLETDRSFPFRLDGRRLDTDRPLVTLTFARDARFARLRERISDLRQRLGERRTEVLERRDARVDARRELLPPARPPSSTEPRRRR